MRPSGPRMRISRPVAAASPPPAGTSSQPNLTTLRRAPAWSRGRKANHSSLMAWRRRAGSGSFQAATYRLVRSFTSMRVTVPPQVGDKMVSPPMLRARAGAGQFPAGNAAGSDDSAFPVPSFLVNEMGLERRTPVRDRNRWIALVVLCAGMLMIVLDMTIVNVALPSMQADLGFSQAGLAWVVNAYLIAFAGLLLLAGRLGDLAGRRNVFLGGLAVFTVASLLCGLAANKEMLVAARFLQGMGGALTSAVILGMIVTMFPGPREQAQAIGVFAFVASAGAAVGLLAGGILTQVLNWHWIFFVNLPVGAATAVAAIRVIERDRGAGYRAGADVPGALLITASMMLGVLTIVDPAAQQGWLAARTLIMGAGTLALLAGFIVRQKTARHPLMPLRIFSSRAVTGSNLVQVFGTAGMFGMFFLGSLYLRQILHYDPLQIGLAFLPVAVVMGALSVRYTDRLVMRFGARKLLFPGLGLIAAGLALFATIPATGGTYLSHILPVTLLIG